MVRIVQPDTNHFANTTNTWTQARRTANQRMRMSVERSDFFKGRHAQHGAADVIHMC